MEQKNTNKQHLSFVDHRTIPLRKLPTGSKSQRRTSCNKTNRTQANKQNKIRITENTPTKTSYNAPRQNDSNKQSKIQTPDAHNNAEQKRTHTHKCPRIKTIADKESWDAPVPNTKSNKQSQVPNTGEWSMWHEVLEHLNMFDAQMADWPVRANGESAAGCSFSTGL